MLKHFSSTEAGFFFLISFPLETFSCGHGHDKVHEVDDASDETKAAHGQGCVVVPCVVLRLARRDHRIGSFGV